MNVNDVNGQKKFIYKSYVVVFLLALICCLEGYLHRNLDFMFINSLQNSTVLGLTGHYVHGFMYDNDLDQVHIHPEGYGLAKGTYYLSGRFDEGVSDKLDISNYGGDTFRILLPFLASIFVNFFTLHDSYVVVNTIIWILASISMWWLGKHLFLSDQIGLISGFLGATSYVFIVLAGADKGEIFQIAYYICLVGISFILEQYTNDLSPHGISNSILLGLFAGFGMFAGGSTVYFIAFMLLYSLITTRFRIFIMRSSLVLIPAFLVMLLVQQYLLMPEATSETSSLVYLISQMQFNVNFLNSARLRFIKHFIYLVPTFLWIGAIAGLFRIKKTSLVPIICMLITYFVSEFIMFTVQGSRGFIWTINYYYLQILLPVYLLNARFIDGLLFRWNFKKKITVFSRIVGISYILIVVIYSNLALFGNRYNYYVGYRAISNQVLYHSWNAVDNLSVYQEMVK